MNERSLSLLHDLRPAFEGYYGISQETRMTFSLLHALDRVAMTGLLHHPRLPLARGLRVNASANQAPTAAEKYRVLSSLVTSTIPRTGPLGSWRERADAILSFGRLELRTILGAKVPLFQFDGAEFGDFLWRTLFHHALPPDDFENCRTTPYVALRPPWRAMHATSLLPWYRKYAHIDTSGFDIVIAQTPWPGVVDRRTQLIVRYHDAVPVFLPHTAHYPRLSRYFHIAALKENAKSAFFACPSEHSRQQLIRLFPNLEGRSFIVNNCISEAFFPEAATAGAYATIIRSRIEPATEPPFGSAIDREAFYEAHLKDEFRYILVVSTLEPRKNHLGLLAGWEAMRMRSGLPIKLVLVGSPGWRNASVLNAIRKWQVRGELFHLSSVPPSELRLLYGGADAVVCPSVSEGFDLPSVEALRCGSAVVASNIPVHREILGDAALYFDPYSPADACDTLLRAFTDAANQDLRRKAPIQGAHYERSRILDQWRRVIDHCRAARSEP